MIKEPSNRPVCVHCGKTYGQRTTTTEVVKWKGDPVKFPRYTGNGVVVRERLHRTGSTSEIKTTNHAGRMIGTGSGELLGVAYDYSDNVAYREVWDGHSWRGGYDPFCTLRCALDYARRAYKATLQPTTKRVVR